jgi:ribosomal protein L1
MCNDAARSLAEMLPVFSRFSCARSAAAALGRSSCLRPELLAVRYFAAPAQGKQQPVLSNVAKAKLEKEKRLKKKRSKLFLFKVRSGPTFHVDEALRIVRATARANFDETVELQVHLGIDPRKPNQNIRGVAQLPFGTGKPVSIAVFARGDKAEEARAAGASFVGAEDLVERIAGGELGFSKVIATPDTMPIVGKVARVRRAGAGVIAAAYCAFPPSPPPLLPRSCPCCPQILGPRGLMPNPKMGTVTTAVREAVQVRVGWSLRCACS